MFFVDTAAIRVLANGRDGGMEDRRPVAKPGQAG